VVDAVEMQLVGVRVELPTNQPIVLLREREGERFLPIWIGPVEATAIAFALQGIVTQRPMTHDLLKSVLEEVGVTIERIVITELRETTFYATLEMARDGAQYSVSSRPSDAIALAGIVIHDEDEETEVQKFREFIESVSPEDFGANPF